MSEPRRPVCGMHANHDHTVRQPASEPASEQDVELWHRVDGRSSFEWMLWVVGPMNSEQARWFKTEAEARAALAAARGDTP